MTAKAKPRPVDGTRENHSVVPMPSFVDPHLPEAAGASVNYGHARFEGVEQHPLEHGESYGAVYGGLNTAESTDAEGNVEPLSDPTVPADDPNDRSKWNSERWKEEARKYDLAVGGSKSDLIKRVTDHEAELAKAAENGGTGTDGEEKKEGGSDGS